MLMLNRGQMAFLAFARFVAIQTMFCIVVVLLFVLGSFVALLHVSGITMAMNGPILLRLPQSAWVTASDYLLFAVSSVIIITMVFVLVHNLGSAHRQLKQLLADSSLKIVIN